MDELLMSTEMNRQEQSLKEEIINYRRRLELRKQERAKKGINTPPEVIIEIEDLEAKIEELQAELATFQKERTSQVSQQTASRSSAPKPGLHRFYLPPKAYHRLVGRSDELKQIKNALRDPKRKSIIAVIGLGGIGKTALAREAVDWCEQKGHFDYIIWISAKVEHFIGQSTVRSEGSVFDFNHILNEIGKQSGWKAVEKAPLSQKTTNIKHLLATKHVLIILDNLETVPDSDKLVNDVFQILGKSKLFITSRFHSHHDRVFTITLSGLSEKKGVTFLREESKERGIDVVAQARDEELIQIHNVTGGAPLAMKLVIGQMGRQPMMVVLNELQAAKVSGQDYEFYRFVFQHSWNMLDQDAKQVLVSMSVFPPGTGGIDEDVIAVSQVEKSAFYPAMDQLVLMSLTDSVGSLEQQRYAIHQLTHYFILSDIVKAWD